MHPVDPVTAAHAIERDVVERLPRRLLALGVVALLLIALLPGCGALRFDPDQPFGARHLFERQERWSGGAGE